VAEILVIGGGMAGQTAAMLLAKDGHSVTVLERDAAPPPASVEEAWAHWERRGVDSRTVKRLRAAAHESGRA
jgi:2-polyprenyl-6-methoxyphenol hydroxylase-like FAD-dependent oxidoreductase